MNLKIREFQQTIINYANQCELPIEVKRLCFAEILRQIEAEANKEIKEEIRVRDEAEQAEMEAEK